MALLCNNVSHWLGANLESALYFQFYDSDAPLAVFFHGIKDFVNTLRPRQNGRHFTDDPFKRIFLNETLRIFIKISPNFVPKGPINNIPALIQ